MTRWLTRDSLSVRQPERAGHLRADLLAVALLAASLFRGGDEVVLLARRP